MKIKLIFAWYDLWIGAFWDSKKKWLYVFPIPMFGLILKFNSSENTDYISQPFQRKGTNFIKSNKP